MGVVFGHPVSNPSESFDSLALAPELQAQAPDKRVNGTRFDLRLVIPDVNKQDFPCQHAAKPLHQQLQQLNSVSVSSIRRPPTLAW